MRPRTIAAVGQGRTARRPSTAASTMTVEVKLCADLKNFYRSSKSGTRAQRLAQYRSSRPIAAATARSIKPLQHFRDHTL